LFVVASPGLAQRGQSISDLMIVWMHWQPSLTPDCPVVAASGRLSKGRQAQRPEQFAQFLTGGDV